jgi:hypothetical protein
VTTESILTKARALKADAVRLRAGAEAEENARRVLNRVDELSTTLDGLEQALDAVRKLRARGVEVVLPPLDDGRLAFEQHAGTGLPPQRAFTTAKAKIEATVQKVRAELAPAWATWTAAQITGLPVHRFVMLPLSERSNGQRSFSTLTKLSKIEVPSAGNVAEFAVVHSGLKEDLEALPEPLPELQGLLQRLGQRTTLDQLTDADIALLRQHDVADQIEVQRRAV